MEFHTIVVEFGLIICKLASNSVFDGMERLGLDRLYVLAENSGW